MIFTIAVIIVTAWTTASLPRVTTLQDLVQVGVGYANLETPDALQAEDIVRWGRLLNASAPQQDHLAQQYRHFVDRHNAFMENEGRDYLSQAAELSRVQRDAGMRSKEYLDATSRFDQSSEHFRTGLERLENEYIDALVPVLEEHQLDTLHLCRLEASRRQLRTQKFLTRWANIDLRLVWEAIWDESISEADCNAMENVLAEYENRVTLSLERAVRQQRRARSDLLHLFIQADAGELDPVAVTARYRAIWDRIGNLFRIVREETQLALELAIARLSPALNERFEAEAKMAAFPELYPDTTEIDRLLKALLASSDIDTDTKDDVRDLHVAYLEEYRAVCMKLESVCVEWGDQSARGQSGYEPQKLKDELEPMLNQRTEVSEKWFALLKDQVGEVVVTAHQPKPISTVRSAAQWRAMNTGQLKPAKQLRERARQSQGGM